METIKWLLSTYPKKTITLAQLEELMKPYFQTYEEFSNTILYLESDEVIRMVKSKGRTSRTPSLALQYSIDKSLLVANHHVGPHSRCYDTLQEKELLSFIQLASGGSVCLLEEDELEIHPSWPRVGLQC
ncbi:MAG: hypothetical protein WD907_03940, partial [Bacilli bacterium]